MDGLQQSLKSLLRPYTISLGVLSAVGGAVGLVAYMTQSWLTYTDIAIIVVVPVLWIAVRYGRWPSIFTALVGAIGTNFFFYPPIFAFGLKSLHDAVTFAAYLTTALTTASLAGRLRDQACHSARQEQEITALYGIGRSLISAGGSKDIGRAATKALADLTGTAVVLMRKMDDGWTPLSDAATLQFDAKDNAAAQAATAQHRATGRGTNVNGESKYLFIPVGVTKTPIGVIAINDMPPIVASDRLRLLLIAADQIAIALENAMAQEAMASAHIRLQADEFRRALLNSVSHDFRTPLSTILGAATSLLDEQTAHPKAVQITLLEAIRDAAERINRYVQNLLALTCIKSGPLTVRREWTDALDLLGGVVQRFETASGRPMGIAVEEALPLLHIDPVLIEQVIVNLVDNAVKFSEPGCRIEASARVRGSDVIIDFFNEGSQLDENPERLFEVGFRGAEADRSGSGLGLSICRAFMGAHGGEITAMNDPTRNGVIFRLVFPNGAALSPESSLMVGDE